MKLITVIAIILFSALTGFCVESTHAAPANEFLNSIGACVHIQHGQDASKLVEPLKYAGIRNIRDGADGNYNTAGLRLLHENANVMVVFGPGSGAKEDSLEKTLIACRELASAHALLAIEGPNEPNNFGGVTFEGKNSDKLKSWLPVAKYQQKFYDAIKADPVLSKYPVYGPSECGAEDDNVGLQFLEIPPDAKTLMPDGTRYADVLNVHNYVCGHIKGLIDNQPSLAAAVKPAAAIDHLFGNHGLTWRKHFKGYDEAQLQTLPKVTTETGWVTDNTPAGDERQGKVLMNTFLAQFKAGWQHTFVYEFADDPDGSFGFYKIDLTTPRASAHYLHNLTTILAGVPGPLKPVSIKYTIQNQPTTVHELVLQRSDVRFDLIIWGEQVKGENPVTMETQIPFASIEVFDPTVGVEAVQKRTNTRSISLKIGDHALVLLMKLQ